MSTSPTVPGLYFAQQPPPAEPAPLRSDIAGFVARTRRGPVGVAVRVQEWKAYLAAFGGLVEEFNSTYSVRGYFENGGEVAWIVRVGGAIEARTAVASVGTEWEFTATSPGTWANGMTIRLVLFARGPGGRPAVDIFVYAAGEPPEYYGAVPFDEVEPVLEGSNLVRLTKGPSEFTGRRTFATEEAEFSGGTDPLPTIGTYADALHALQREPEPALLIFPDIYRDLDSDESEDILAEAVTSSDEQHDRIVVLDVPPGKHDAVSALAWAAEWLAADRQPRTRAAAIYHPCVKVPDPLGGVVAPLRSVPPSGHTAGLISRLDRDRGAHHTPANAPLYEAIDTTRSFSSTEEGLLLNGAVNLLRCRRGRGLVVWGDRTLGAEPHQYIAHRRLIHRLVRAIRRVAEPLVFDMNGPELRLTLVRAVTTVLLAAYRGGGLKGARPEEGFQVQCDERNNPPEVVDAGQVICDVSLAPAVPMEFITLRIELGREGRLEIFES